MRVICESCGMVRHGRCQAFIFGKMLENNEIGVCAPLKLYLCSPLHNVENFTKVNIIVIQLGFVAQRKRISCRKLKLGLMSCTRSLLNSRSIYHNIFHRKLWNRKLSLEGPCLTLSVLNGKVQHRKTCASVCNPTCGRHKERKGNLFM